MKNKIEKYHEQGSHGYRTMKFYDFFMTKIPKFRNIMISANLVPFFMTFYDLKFLKIHFMTFYDPYEPCTRKR